MSEPERTNDLSQLDGPFPEVELIEDFMRQLLLDFTDRIEQLEQARNIGGNVLSRLPPMRTSVEIATAMEMLKERLTRLEDLFEEGKCRHD